MAEDAPPEKKQLGRYTILYELGQGAMGTVYRGHDPQIDREVALKTISLHMLGGEDEKEFRERFFREARAAGKLSHPGIVTIHDAGEDEATRTPYLVMEFVAGMTLEVLGESGALPREKALELTKQIAEALDYAHARGIVHRDIKPANIIVDAEGRAKITDFGIAKLATSKFTQTGMVLGTPAFMSPEQLTAQPVDGRSDIFSLGTIFYWLLTGKRPFGGDTLAALSYSVVHAEPPPVTQVAPGLPADIEHVVKRALAKDPAQRYATGKEFANDLDDLVHGRPPRSRAGAVAAAVPAPLAATIALPAPAAEKRRRWIVPVALVALLLIGLGLGAWWWPGRSEVEEEAEPAVAAPTPAPRTSAPAPRTAPSRSATVSVSTLRLRGSHSFDSGTVTVYADGSRVAELSLEGGEISGNLRVASDTSTISVRIRAVQRIAGGSGGWVPPGQRKRRAAAGATVRQFDEQASIRARFEPGESRTLEIYVGNTLSLRWGD
jgi:serine/threonine-protein kinase